MKPRQWSSQQGKALGSSEEKLLMFLTDDDTFSNVFCENSKKLISVDLFALAAKYYSLSNLGVCTPLEDVLEALRGDNQGTTGIKTDEFMNNKKSHEVQVMSELVDKIANYCGIKQVIDIGSGKGYLSSFLSMQYNLQVYGIDSSNSNTNGAHERNRKLKKHWRAYQSRGRANLKSQRLEKANDRTVESEIKCKAVDEKPLNNDSSLQSQDQVPSCGFTEIATSETSKQTEVDLVARTQSDENKLSEEVLAILNVLPSDAVEVFSSSHGNCGELCEEEKAQRKMASLKAKASKSSESNLYFPLTSCITAETELSDIITDLEDCVMVGLHTCGDLAANTLRIFTAKPEIKAVCSVGCCYHLLSEQFENQEDCPEEVWGFPMCQYLKDKGWCCGRNARMSACLALERVAVGQMLPTESLFYRAVLQVIIEEIYGVTKSDRHVGKTFSKSSSFIDYVRKSLKKLELDDSKLPDSCIMDYYEKYKHRMNELEAFNMLKVVLAPCIEVLILLDRLCYLKEQDNIAWSGLVKLFDPVKSPRCYAVIALKKQ
ncbi:probable methyltransferase-like protein 25 isoform X2 [Grus americana]|nr:probable methyltransferase-like protein 25 isoform X2 [Grus americana]XP_054680039.1 probable methyltransferase-like protein 25 isoform X2 [Grus americana]XP_054680050.1 probable methyltransferase-like protein 25 isoform X2 [Grus americana]XP_054680061.1 probable methyltransferase-like protein 25 isoform X2 [Grus americana]